jgi:hypothetical protein
VVFCIQRLSVPVGRQNENIYIYEYLFIYLAPIVEFRRRGAFDIIFIYLKVVEHGREPAKW